jgi:hypothetical protein
MARWMRRKEPLVPFEDYGFTAEDYRAHRAWVLDGAPEPDPDTVERVRRWNEDTYEMRQASEAVRDERRRRFWHGFWTLAGISAIALFAAAFALSLHVYVSPGGLATMGTGAMVIGLAAVAGRDSHRKDD